MNYDEGVPLWRFVGFVLGMALLCSCAGALARHAIDQPEPKPCAPTTPGGSNG